MSKKNSGATSHGGRDAKAAMALALLAAGWGAGALALDSSPAQANAAQSYEIPPGPVAAALNRLADKSGAVMVYDAHLAWNKVTQGFSGRYTLDDALDKLLAGTGLAYRLAPGGKAVAIMLAQNDAATQSDAGAVALPAIDVAGSGGAGSGEGSGGAGCGQYGGAPCSGFGGAGLAQDPFNTTYVLPEASIGTKTDTPIMDTPLNVQVITQQVLRDQQVITLDQALQNVSGVTVANGAISNGNPYDSIVLRGFPTSNIFRNGFRQDGYVASTVSAQQLANVASIEVLKGPAAILYGLSEPGGIVNIVTKEPLNTPYYAASQQIGSFANYRTTLDATGPLTEDKAVLYRMDMSYQNNGAPYGSPVDLTHSQDVFVAPVVKWNVDAATSVKLEAQYDNSWFYNYFPDNPVYNGVFVTIPRGTNYQESTPLDRKSLFTALTWSHQFDNDWSIKQQIAYSRWDLGVVQENGAGYIDTTSASVPVYDRGYGLNSYSQTTYSTNVDITGHIDTFGAKHTLLLGGDFYKFNTYSQYFASTGTSYIDVWNPVHPGTTPPFFNLLQPGYEFTNPQDTAGLYLQDQVKLPYNFFLLAGARYQYIRENGGLTGSPTFAANPTVNHANEEQAVTPRFGLLWRPEQWVSFYANYTEGFGANSGTIYPNIPVPPTSAREGEAGVKFDLLDGKLRITADYYNLTKTNIATTDPSHLPLGAYSVVTGAARSKGPELDIQGTLLPGWSVILAYANQDVRVTQQNPGGYPVALEGQRFPGIPQNLGSFWTTYEFQPDSALKGWKIGGGVVYHGPQPIYDNSFSGQSYLLPMLPGYAIVNLMTAYSFKLAGTDMTAQVNVTNLLNHTYYTDAAMGAYGIPPLPASGLQAGYRTYGAPLTIMGSLSAQFAGSPILANANAAAPAPAFTWTGVYLGGQIGYGWGDNNGNVSYATPGGLSGVNPLNGDASGVIGGAHAGYDLQLSNWVVGLEGSVDGTTVQKTTTIGFVDAAVNLGGYFPYSGSVSSRVQSPIQGSIRGRVGYAFDRLLIYGTGGAAFGGFATGLILGAVDLTGSYYAIGGHPGTRVGWTAGGGLEYAIDNNWSVRSEYRYSDFGHFADLPVSPVAGLGYSANRQLAQNQVQVGFSYKFDGFAPEPVIAKY